VIPSRGDTVDAAYRMTDGRSELARRICHLNGLVVVLAPAQEYER